jgi:hypothetical protein
VSLRIAVGLAFLMPAAAARAADRPAEAEAKKLVAMVHGSLAGSASLGAAVVFAVEDDRLYLVTADHLVRRETETATDLWIELKSLPGEHLPAEVLLHRDPDLDLTVLMVRNAARRGVTKEMFPFDRLGDPKLLERGAKVFSIGQARGEAWWSNVNPDLVAVRSGSSIEFESSFLGPGQSGGGLFNEGWLLVGMVLGDRAPNGKAVRIDEALDFVRRHNYPVSFPAEPVAQSVKLSCSTKSDSFTVAPFSRDNGLGGSFGIDSSAFRMTVAAAGAGDKRCVDCRMKGATFRISATVWGDGKAGASGLYILDMSEVRGEMFTFEVEPGGRAAIKHYRDGRDTATLWAGAYSAREKNRLTLEAKDGVLVASANGRELGRASYDAKAVPDVPLGSGFIVTTGARVPATVWFDDYELTTCFPETAR